MLHKKIFAEAEQLNKSVKMQWVDQDDLLRIIKIKLTAVQKVLTGIKPLENIHRHFLAQCFEEIAILAGENVKNQPLQKKSEYLRVAITQLKAIIKPTQSVVDKIQTLSTECEIISSLISNNRATIFGATSNKQEMQFTVAPKNFECKVGI